MGYKNRIIVVILVLASILVAGPIFAQSNWPTYHYNEGRLGVNEAEKNLYGPDISIIWTFPRYDVLDTDEEDSTYIVDIPDSTSDWALSPSTSSWQTSSGMGTVNPPANYYGGDFYWIRATTEDGLAAAKASAKWDFTPSATLPPGLYTVQVWFPSSGGGKVNSSEVCYTVQHKDGSSQFVIDQSTGGRWVTLGSSALYMDSGSYVEMSNVTDDAEQENTDVVVCADAVRFVPSSGMEIYSSPAAAASAPVGINGEDIPAVWIGTIETPIASLAEGMDGFGAFYCVRSYQGTSGINYADLLDSSSSVWDTNDEVKYAGTAAWRYPRAGAFDKNSDGTAKSPNNRLPIEGPIGGFHSLGGVYSSPTLIESGSTKYVVFGGMDGQVYCLNANTGDLIWKGPGVTISEPATRPSTWALFDGRYDAFGGKFLAGPTVADESSEVQITWDITSTSSDPGTDSLKTDGTGHKYAIYAWMPARNTTTETAARSTDAAYSITYWDPVYSQERTDCVRVDQRDSSESDDSVSEYNCGTWVKIGSDYWDPRKVELSNVSQAGSTDRVVIADAIMVVPAELGAFSYSTAVSDGTNVYIGNANGRVYAFALKSSYPTSSKSAALAWTFPKVQTKNPITDTDDSLASSFGSLVSSPTLTSGHLLVSSMDGNVYDITNLTGGEKNVKLEWKFNASSVAGTSEAFSSSPAIYGSKVYAASVGGRLYALKIDDGTCDWSCPDASISEAPLSAFRFSTPAVYDTGIFCGSTGGQVYGFTSTGSYISESTFTPPNMYAPIQGAVAIDDRNIYIGTVGTGSGDDGGIWWVNRDSGLASDDLGEWTYSGYSDLGMVFSSPAVANDYVYVGTGKGRLCAFSSTAFGGEWVGGGREQAGQPPLRRAKAPNPAKTCQVDIFKPAVYKETLKVLRSLVDAGTATNSEVIGKILADTSTKDSNLFVENDFDGAEANILKGHARAFPYESSYTSGSGDREVYMEWGEDLYLIAWNLPPLSELTGGNPTSTTGVGTSTQKNCVSFKFNNSGSGSSSGGTINPKNADYLFEYKTSSVDGNNLPIFRCVAFTKVELRGSGQNQPSPGTGWNITLQVTRSSTTDPLGVMPLLTGTPGSFTVKNTTKWESQPVGINNPLAIRDDGYHPSTSGPVQESSISLGWSKANSDGTYETNRNESTAHYNGNSIIETDTTSSKKISKSIMPLVYLGQTHHGASSRVAPIQVMDRSAMGLKATVGTDNSVTWNSYIDKFRIETADLHWNENAEPVNPLPWDLLPYADILGYTSRQQTDYPDITKRSERFQKDTGDPSVDNNALLPALPKNVDDADSINYDEARLQAESIDTWIEVPKYQPANIYGPGYQATAIAYIDSNSDGTCNLGNQISGRPTSYIEAHRYFAISSDVLPDYHIVVEKPLTIDVVGADKSAAPHGLGVYLDSGLLTDWWKEFTVQNLGNVNLYDIKIARYVSNGGANSWMVSLYSDSVSPYFPLLGYGLTDTTPSYQFGIVSSFDGWDPKWGSIGAEPFMTNGYGYTLSKARVGDVDPTTLTIPDQRKCNVWPNVTSSAIDDKGGSSNTGIEPSVSVIVPLTQPTGSYSALVPVFADMINTGTDNVLDLGYEAYTDPTFRLNVSVAEDRLTGGSTAGSITQIDPSQDPNPDPTKKFICGDTQPAAWRDPSTGNTFLFWSSNRSTSTTVTVTPNAPWYIRWASLIYDKGSSTKPSAYSWKADTSNASSTRWWDTPLNSEASTGGPAAADADRLPASDWPVTLPNLLSDSVKYSSPFAAMNLDTWSLDNPMKVWLFWQGQADAIDPQTKKVNRNSLIFYTLAAGGSSTEDGKVYSFSDDLNLMKLNPRAIVYNSDSNEVMWLMWHGGDSGRWSLFGNLNVSPDTQQNADGWCSDIRFATPSCLVSVSEPSPVHRSIGSTSITDRDRYIDVAYTGASKYDQTSDIIFTRYKWSGTNSSPSVNAVKLPRVYDEELTRDTKRNVYTSEHLSWVKAKGTGAIDEDVLTSTSDSLRYLPVVRVLLTDDYTTDDGVTFTKGTIVSATDGSVTKLNNVVSTAGIAIAPAIDQATGVYTYTLPGDAGSLLGKMLVDYSAGIVRFTNPLPTKTKVFAFYTPQSKRLTHGSEQDSAPYMFIEKTEMNFACNPGFGPSDYTGLAPTDRLWLFWRKPSTNVQASTIYYKTYRITATLNEPVDMNSNGKPTADIEVGHVFGPCEVSWDGKKVYFTSVDERYPGLSPSGLEPVSIKFRPKGGSSTDRVTETFDTLSWEEELPETALPTRLRVNEGQVCAFADPCVTPSRVWVFWSSTRAGESDLYYQIISPNFRAVSP
ncbi:MAG: PQQ-binding-like beta-propeller repeat protein [Armatimonadota bacterium]